MQSTDDAPKQPRILEVGVNMLFLLGMPQQTDWYYTGPRHPSRLGSGCKVLTPWNMAKVIAQLRRGEYDLVVVHPPLYAPWHPRSFLGILKARQLTYSIGVFSTFAIQFTRWVRHTPMVVVDLNDSFTIGRHSFYLLDRANAFYKRELPVDHWRVFTATGHRNLPAGTFRHKKRYERYLEKLRPMSIGTFDDNVAAGTNIRAEKTTDVFFAGEVNYNSTVRKQGLRELEALREQGYRVDIPTTRLPREEFLKRCASAWLVWSPEGLGWECFRHYEAPLMHSVPVINSPTITRHAPLRHGEHALYYDIEEQGLTRTIVAALRDKPKLLQMAAAAREHVAQHHTHGALCRHIVSQTLPQFAETLIPPGQKQAA